MFDTIVDTIRMEAAIQGPRGITSDRLWGIVESTIAKNASAISDKYDNAAPLVDLAYKCCFWPILLQDKRLEFFEDLDATIEEPSSDQQQQQTESPTEIAPVTEGQNDNLSTTSTTTPSAQQNKATPAKRKKAKAPAKKAKSKPKKVVKKPVKKKAKKRADSDDDFSSDGYEPPSDDEESTDEDEYEEGSNASESSEDDDDDDDKEEEKDAPKTNKPNDYDPLANILNTNYRRIDEIAELSFDKVEQLYGTRLRILADKELQTEQLYVGTPPTARAISHNLQIILTFIMQAGPPGITQAKLSKALELDPRSSGHYVKVLEQKGAITRKPVAHQGIRTNICIHVRYNEEDSEKTRHEYNAYNVNASGIAFTTKRLRSRMVDLLLDAKNNVMYSDDILSALGFNPREKAVKKWYHRSIEDLCEKNIFRKVRGEMTKVRTSRCIQLVNPNQALIEQKISPKLTVNKYKFDVDDETKRRGGSMLVLKISGAEDRPVGGQYYDTSLESQIVDVLEAASTNGVTQKEIMYSLNYGDPKGMHKYLDNMSCLKESPEVLKYLARRDFEFEGRIRRYRYYNYQSYEKLKRGIDVNVTGPPLYQIANSKLKEEDFKRQSYELNATITKRSGGKRKTASQITSKTIQEASSSAASGTIAPQTSTENAEASTTTSPQTSSASADNNATLTPSNANNQSAKLAPIFQMKRRANKNTSQLDDSTQNDNETVAAKARKRTRDESLESEENLTNKASKQSGRPTRKAAKIAAEAVAATAAATTALANINEANESIPETLSEETADQPVTPATNADTATQNASEVPLISKGNDHPPKSIPELTEDEGTVAISKTTTENEAPAHRKRGPPLKKKRITNATKKPESSNQSESHAIETTTDDMTETQTVPASSADNPITNESVLLTTENADKQTVQTALNTGDQDIPTSVENSIQLSTPERAPSPQPVIASPRRGNLFDYFSSSRNSPGPSSSRQGQSTSPRERSPGRLYQQLVEVRLDATPIPTSSHSKNRENREIEKDTSTLTVQKPTSSEGSATQSSVSVPPSAQIKPTTNIPKSSDKNTPKVHSNNSNIISTKLGIKSSRHIRHSNNAYKEQREKVLLALLDETPVWERSHDLKNTFLKKMKELYPTGAIRPGLCLKTLWKSAEDLVEAGEARFHELSFTHINASKVTKKLFFRKDIDVDGPELKEYVNYMKEKKALRSARPNRLTKYEKLDNKVERLEERLERMEEEYEALEDKEGIDALRLDDEIRMIKANMTKVTKLEEAMGDVRTTSGNWLTIGLQFGFVHARLLRAKLFHQHMFGLLSQDIDGVDRETRTIKTSTIISWMTLNLYCQTIGIFIPHQELLDFTEDSSNMDKYMWELPDSIKMDLFAAETKFRNRIRNLTDALEGMGVIKAKSMKLSETLRQFRSDAKDLPDSYQLQPSAVIRDYRRADMRIIGKYTLDSPSDLLIYWSDLQYISTDVQPALDDSTEDSSRVVTEQMMEMKRMLYTPRNWSTNTVIDRELRNLLNSYIDSDTKTTPIGDPEKCKDIAAELQVPIPMVVAYFKKMQAAFDRQIPNYERLITNRLEDDLKPKRRTPRKRVYHAEDFAEAISDKRVFQRTTRGSTKRRLLKEFAQDSAIGQSSSNKELYLDDESEMPLIHDHNQVEKARLRRTTRALWTPEEDELLIYCYVIMRHHTRVNNLRFLWAPGTDVLSNRSPQQLRTRIDRIKVMPAISEYIFTLSRLWQRFFEQGLQDGVFEEESKNFSNYNLLERLVYFIQRLQGVNDEMARDNPLPATTQALYANFRVERTMNPTEKERCSIEDQFHQKVTMMAKNRVLISGFLTMNSSIATKMDCPSPEIVDEKEPKRRIIELLKIFLRMALLTPFEVYDPFFAHAVISHYPSSLVNLAVQEMRNAYQIAKSKGVRSMSRKLPGMFWSISKKYLHDMACSLPQNFFLQAAAYEKFLTTEGKSLFMPILVSSGMMGCTLDLLSEKKLTLFMADEDQQQEKYQEPIHRTRTLDQTKLDFNVGLESVSFDDGMVPVKEEESKRSTLRTNSLTALSHDRMKTELFGFLSSQKPVIRRKLKDIMEFLHKAQGSGATIFEIKDNLLKTFPNIRDSQIRECVETLRNAHPPFIHHVGFESLRYVSTSYLDDWVVQTRGLSSLKPSSAEATERARLMTEKRTELIDPRLWIDLNGSVTKKLLDECLQVVFQRVMERPGILERDVRRLFENRLSYAEVKDLLDMLVARKAIRKVAIVSSGPMKKTLFSKPRKFTKASDSDVIDRTVQTSYFSTQGYFRQLAPECETEQ